MIILHRGWAIKEWTLLFWTISARYLLNNPNNYENRGGPVLSAILWRTIPAKIHGFIFNFSTWILQLNSKFCTLPYLGKTFLHFSLIWSQLFYLTVLGVHFQLALSNYTATMQFSTRRTNFYSLLLFFHWLLFRKTNCRLSLLKKKLDKLTQCNSH